jgi:hypothetical protein
MPRNVDPGTIQVGKGLAPEGTVEDNALRYPERDVDPLRVHIHDPSRAHMAATIGIVDANDCYVSDEVEGALQELCSGSGAGRLNGLIAGGTFSELGCAPNGSAGGVHATLTLCAPTEIMMNGTVLDAAGLTVSLAAVNTVYFIYLDTQVSSPTYRELVAATGSPPQVEEGDPNATTGPGSIEQVMLAKVTVDGAGNVASWQDARFFVRNLDRKVQYSSRQGENVDAWSEGCFANLQAFFFWAEFYGDGALASSNEEEKGTILIRGTHSITAALTVPTDHLQFVGDGEAVIELNGIAAPYAAFETGRSDITFRNITFKTNLSGCVGISASGTYSDLTIEDCRFVSGTGNFNIAISAMGGPANVRILIRDCYIEAENMGVQADGFGSTNAYGIKAEDCTVKGTGIAGSKGFVLGTGTTSGSAYITGCSVTDMETGIRLQETSSTEISGCSITEAVTGILFANGASTITHKITNNTIVLTDNQSLHGIYIGPGNTQVDITGNYVRSLITGNHPSEPYGIGFQVAKGDEYCGLRIADNTVIAFYDATNNVGHGIAAFATDTTGTTATITGNTLSRCDIYTSRVSDITVTGNSVDALGAWSGAAGPTIGGGINLESVANATVTGNNIHCQGTIPNGIELRQGKHLTVTGNTVLAPTQNGILASASLVGGAGPAFMEHFTITGNTVDGWLDLNQPSANGILVGLSTDNGAPDRGVIDGNNVQKCGAGIILQGFSVDIPIRSMLVTNNIVAECALDQDTYDRLSWANSGSKSIGLQYGKDITVQGNTISMTGVILNPATGTPIVFPNDIYARPVYSLNSTVVTVDNNTISSSSSFGNGDSMDITHNLGDLAGDFASELMQITGNKIVTADAHNAGSHRCVSVFAEESVHQIKLLDTTVRGNTINSTDGLTGDGFGFGVSIFAGSHVGISGCSIENNAISSFLVLGIQVSLLNAAPQGDVEMRNLRIRGNTVQSMGSVGPIAGIAIEQHARTSFSSKLSKVSIEGNTVERGWGNGISINAIATTATTGFVGLDTVTVSGNLVNKVQSAVALGAVGIEIRLRGGDQERVFTGADLSAPWSKEGVQDITVKDNIITDVTRNIDLDSEDCLSCTRLAVDNNEGWGNGTDNLGPTGDFLSRIQFSLTDNTHRQDISAVSVSGNKMMLSAQTRQVDNLNLRFHNADVSVLSVQDNLLNATTGAGGPAYHGRAIYLQNPCSTTLVAPFLRCREVFLSGNVVGGGIHLNAVNSDPSDVNVSANQVVIPLQDTPSGLVRAIPLHLQFDGGTGTTGHQATSISVKDNALAGGTIGCFIQYDDMNGETLCVEGNRVNEPLAAGIVLQVDQDIGTATTYLRQVGITGNFITRNLNTVSGIGIWYQAAKALSQSFEVSRNQIYRQAERAIFLQLGGESPGIPGFTINLDRNIQVDDNQIESCNTDAGALPVIEVSIDPKADVSSAAVTAFSISGNAITNSGGLDGVTGIYAALAAYKEAEMLRFSNNVVSPQVGGFGVGYGAGIEVELPETNIVSIDNNQMEIMGFQPATTGLGIGVHFLDSKAQEVSISGNSILLFDEADYGIRIRSGDQSNMSILAMSISGNQIAATAGTAIYGIHWIGEDGAGDLSGTIEGVQINDNTITDLKTGVWVVQSENGMAHNNLYLKSCAMDGNSVTDCTLDGLKWACGGAGGRAGNTHGFSASRNSVITQYLNTSGTQPFYGHPLVRVELGHGLLGVGSANVHQVSVDGNHCYITTADQGDVCWSGVILEMGVVDNAAGLSPSIASTISVSNNHVRNVALVGIGFIAEGWMTIDVPQNEVTGISRVRTCTVSDNIVSMSSVQETQGGATSERNGGILLRVLNATLDQFLFQGNAIRGFTEQSDRHLLNIWSEVTGVPAPYSLKAGLMHEVLTFQGNSIINNNQSGTARDCIKVDWLKGTGFVPDKGIVTNNINSETNTVTMNFDDAEWIFNGAHFHSAASNVKIP